MDLTKEAIQYLWESSVAPQDRLINFDENRWIVINNEGDSKELLPLVFNAKEPIWLHTLSSLVNYIKAGLDRVEERLIVHIQSEREVQLLGTIKEDGSREVLARVEAIIPQFNYGLFSDMESFNIALQSKFVDLSNDKEYDDRALILQVVGNVSEENIRQTGDDGVSQAVTVKNGVASQANVQVPNPVTLAPYRTFSEVDQPASQFIFRMKDGPRAAIFEADGGAWRKEAIENVRQYFLKELNDAKNITILA